MRTRILPPDEWFKLNTNGVPPLGTTLRPEDVQVVVVEDGERIVASLGVFRVTHFESLWIDPEYSGNPGLCRRLIRSSVAAARKWTDKWVWGASDTDKMDSIMGRCGGKSVPVSTFIIPLGDN